MKRKLFKLAKNSIGNLIVGLVFEKTSNLLPINRIYENKEAVAFWHPSPSYEKHILIVPKKAIKNVSVLKDSDNKHLIGVFNVVSKVVNELDLSKKDYSLITNGGTRQEIKQLHFHLISGKKTK